VVVVSLAVCEFSERSFCVFLAAEYRGSSVKARLTHRVRKASFSYESFNFHNVVDIGSTGNGTVNVLARLE